MPELCVELCDMESSRMQMPGSWIFATYIFKNKLKASNSVTSTTIRERIFFPCLKILLGHSKSGGLNVTNTSKIVVYAPTERTEKLLLFFLYSSLLYSSLLSSTLLSYTLLSSTLLSSTLLSSTLLSSTLLSSTLHDRINLSLQVAYY
jgi:hypothetical protein